MRVVVPFTDLRPETKLALDQHAAGHEIEYHDVSGDDVEHCRVLAQAWAAGDTFAIVEHDVVIHEHVLSEFDECPEPYCCFPYAWTVCVGPALGCTRFRAELLAEIPDAMERVAAMPSNWGRPGHWRQVDVYLMRRVLRDQHGLQPHVHLPPVEHLNTRQALTGAAVGKPPVLEVRGWA